MKRKSVEDIIDELKKEVSAKFFKAEPLKEFPEDFLTKRGKKLTGGKDLPALPFEQGGRKMRRIRKEYRYRIDRKKVDIQKAMESYFCLKNLERKIGYEMVMLPDEKVELNIERTVQVCFKKGAVLAEFDCLEKAKYLLYSKKKGQYVYKVPKSKTVVRNAVRRYEKYKDEITGKLAGAFMRRGAARGVAEGLARQVMEVTQ